MHAPSKVHVEYQMCEHRKRLVPETVAFSASLPGVVSLLPMSDSHLSNRQFFKPKLICKHYYSSPAPLDERAIRAAPSIPILLDPHAPEPLPQLPRPARTAPNALLPRRVLLPIAHGPRLAFDAHRSPLRGGRGHFNGVGAFGCVAGVGFVLLEGFFQGVGGLAFTFEVFGEVLLVGRLC